jgi:hypothetical protein
MAGFGSRSSFSKWRVHRASAARMLAFFLSELSATGQTLSKISV